MVVLWFVHRGQAPIEGCWTGLNQSVEQRAGCAIVATNHVMLWMDRPLAGHLGYKPEELVGRTFEQITHPEDVGLDVHLAKRLFADGIVSYEIEKRFVRKDGSIVRLTLHASVIRDPAGAVLYGLAVVTKPDSGRALRVPPEAMLAEQERIRRAMLDS